MKDHRLDAYISLRAKAWNNPWAKRILSELYYLLDISETMDGALDAQIEPVVTYLTQVVEQDGSITKTAALQAEQMLSALQETAKSYEVICAAHAHIDMNWMWGYQETASLTVDTFHTMLRLLKEYPQFCFSQSQASTYEIIEKYHPQMLPEIKKYIQEGRWEVTATSWVENDKNMSGAEAMSRHLLYTRTYLSELLDIPLDSVKLDFEPDTFGHTENLPEILTQGGVKYYYHCRGTDEEYVYKWRAPSGAELLVYRDPTWYNSGYDRPIDETIFEFVPSFCHRYGLHHCLKVYGVGDHGGGPSRRDIECIMEISQWPLSPNIHFGTMQSFFEKLEREADHLPVLDHELNYVFNGCYTSQSTIKRGNRISEDRLYEAEALDVMAHHWVPDYETAKPFDGPWKKVLFNQFHDILPGSGTVETREYAMGLYQDALASVSVNATHAMRQICENIDTSKLIPEQTYDYSTGGGVGYNTNDASGYGFSVTEYGSGLVRAYTLFNTTNIARDEVVELVIWDWPGKLERIQVLDASGKALPCEVLKKSVCYWAHECVHLGVRVTVPAMGYTTVVLSQKAAALDDPLRLFTDPRVDRTGNDPIVLENQKLRAVFDPGSMTLTSLTDKASGQELISVADGGFRLATESIETGMTSWRIGRFAALKNLSREYPVHIEKISRGILRQAVSFKQNFQNSSMEVTYSLDDNSDVLNCQIQVDWREFGSLAGIPQLQYCLPLKKAGTESLCAVPYGICRRPVLYHDVPCCGLMAVKQENVAVAVLSDSKYGFQFDGQNICVDLLRGSVDPDPTPEIGKHTIRLGIAVADERESALLQCNAKFSHPISSCSAPISHAGTLPMENALLRLEGCQLGALKRSEDSSGWVTRVYNPTEGPAMAKLTMGGLQEAHTADIMERKESPLQVKENSTCTEVPPHSVRTLILTNA